MKKIPINKRVNLNLLSEELFDAFPQWKYVRPLDGLPATDVIITVEEIHIPDDTDEQAVQAVIDAHDARGKSKNEREQEAKENKKKDLLDRVRKAGSVDDLKTVLTEILKE